VSDEIRIVRGVPTDEELAAIVGVLLTARTAAPAAEPAETSRWVRAARPGYAAGDGRPTRIGRDAWQASALPR
jgi:hypothetical protein